MEKEPSQPQVQQKEDAGQNLGGSKKNYFKQKIALFFGYNGTAYHGLQKQKDLKEKTTVESCLEIALHEAGFITESNFGDLKKNAWQRCSRTDKGVHAAYNGINCKLNILDSFVDLPPQELEEEKKKDDRKLMKSKLRRDDIIKLINKFLTEDIRCYGFRIVTKNFDIKLNAASRRYEYLCPLKMFYPYNRETYGNNYATDEARNAQIVEALKTYVKKFVGTRNYHNYTKKGNPKEKSSLRYILSMEVDRIPQEELNKISGGEVKNQYVKFKLHGQSFMYHQIRKMVGSMIQTFQLGMDESFFDNTFTYNKTPVWLAPSQGLLLDRILFTGYNKKEDAPESLEVLPAEEVLIEQFKQEIIYKVVLSAEEEQKIYTQWLTAGREFNENLNKHPNFMSHWCNEDMNYNKDGQIDLTQEPVFIDEKPVNDD